jgi:hypothetical protein
MRELLDCADARCDCLVDFTVVDYMLAELRRRPGKDEQVVPLPGLDLGESAVTNLFHRNNVNGNVGIVLPAPVFSKHVHKPLIKLRQEVGPFGDLERLLAGESTLREKEEGAERSGTSHQLQEISTRSFSACVPGHSGYPCFADEQFIKQY